MAADPHLLAEPVIGPATSGRTRWLASSPFQGEVGEVGKDARMIGKLKGIIDSYGEDSIILDVNGVGYLVHCSARTMQELPRVGEAATLSIETHVREDQIRLFGFTSDIEREWFKLLQTVQGVGTKVALAVLGTLKPADLASAIALRDKAMVARTPGVGPKVAERIVTELKDKAPAYTQIDPALVRLSGALDEKLAPAPFTDAVSALVNLGYAQPQAAAAIAAAARSAGEGAEVKTLIRLGLKELAK
jgi:Holliday junction DNA helicase RuvA